MRYTRPRKERMYRAGMFSDGAIALLFALENFDTFCEYFVSEAKAHNKVDSDYALDREWFRACLEQAVDFLTTCTKDERVS